MAKRKYFDRLAWDEAAKLKGYHISPWGCGSADAYKEGEVVGTFTAYFDLNVTDTFGPCGWLR